MTIYFLRLKDPCGCFSNFWPAEVVIDGKKYATNEHWYQSQKYPHDPEWQEHIRTAPTAWAAMKAGRDPSKAMRPDWEDVKEYAMLTGLRAKFDNYPHLRSVLVGTGTEELVEANPKDSYWAFGPDGKGKNRLGELLMQLRSEYQSRQGADDGGLF